MLVLVGYLGIHPFGQVFGRLLGGDAQRFAGFHIHERSGHLAPVAKLERTLPQTAPSDYHDRISGATIDLHEGDDPFTIFSLGIV